ncbi:MAG: MFS transporter [Pseudolabrys sp.]|nr:MFS transporter [Pseudolabrys sp.]
MQRPHQHSVETRQSWVVTTAALFVMMTAFGSAWIVSVALKDIAAEVGGARSVPALAGALLWFFAGGGGILMGALAHRIGTRTTVIIGAAMVAAGLCISAIGPPWPLWTGHAVFMGMLGIGAINAPLYVYVSHWFDKRRGSALALISSGNYLAGAVWPSVFDHVIAAIGWRQTMLGYAVFEIAVIVPLALIFLKAAPEAVHAQTMRNGHGASKVLGLPANVAFGVLCVASIFCCVTMSMPQQHLVAYCSDLGFTRMFGALMLSVLLGTAVFSRQVWGALSDRIGGMLTVLIASIWQVTAMTGFMLTQSEAGLITVSAAFGLGFSGIVPAYVLAVRELFPAREAYWRIPTIMLFTAVGMGLGGWVAGLMYDHFGYYLPAFATGVIANLINLAMIGFLVLWGRNDRRRKKLAPEPEIMASVGA